MDRVSRPLLGLLVATVAGAALWVTALRPSTSSNSPAGTGGGLGQYQSAINAAHGAVAQSSKIAAQQSSASASATSTTPNATTTASAAPATAAGPPAAGATAAARQAAGATSAARHGAGASLSAKSPANAAGRQRAVATALLHGKVLALLFYNPAAPDDRAVAGELRSIPTHRSRVFRLVVPISELSRYSAITNQVPVTTAPTLLLVDRRHVASTIVGFASSFEIAQRVADALAVR